MGLDFTDAFIREVKPCLDSHWANAKIRCGDFGFFFYEGRRLEYLDRLDTSDSTGFSCMFYNCDSLTTIPEYDTSKGTSFYSMFFQCFSLTTTPELDTSNGTNFSHMFDGCGSLTTTPELDTSNGTNFSYMFRNLRSVTAIPALDTSKGTNFNNMFEGCMSLTTISGLDVGSGTSFDNMFKHCSSLANVYLYNIRQSIRLSDNATYGRSLTVDSLVHAIRELCTTTTAQKLSISSTNLAKIADLYCKVTDSTNEKMPMELCESTDEGAMTLSDYAALKNWTIV